MALKAGYKETEVRVIPDDWEVKKLGDFVRLQRGHDLTDRNRRQGSVPVMGSAGQNGFHDTALAKGPGVVLGRSGASYGQVHFCKDDYWPHNTALYVRDFRGNDPRFAYYFLMALDFSPYNSGGAQPSLNRNFIYPIETYVPPLPQQHAIAAILSDADELIATLDKLITKKRDLKQAAMQQLLTGKRRLPGLSGPWKPCKIGDLLVYERPDKYIVRSADYSDNATTPVLTANKSFILGYTDESFGVYTRLPVIVFDDFTTDCKYVEFPFKVKSSAIKLLTARTGSVDVNLKYVYERMRLIRFPLGDHKRYYISEYRHITLPFPEELEQTAIATVLSNMDAEIAMLEARRDKTRAIMQGMMQELLTGKTRLI